MNDISVLIYFICFAIVAGTTFAYMYAMMNSTLLQLNRSKERSNIHPEMEDVKNGEELLVFSMEEEDDCLLYTSPSPRDVEESRMPSSA